MAKFSETLYDSYGQAFHIDELLFENKTDHQHLLIFRNAKFGRAMALDGIVQTTEKDEFVYHEMLTHVPILAHKVIDMSLKYLPNHSQVHSMIPGSKSSSTMGKIT